MSWREREDDPDDLDDPDDPDESDMDDSDEPELVKCPHCGKYISEEAERCHRCGRYVEEPRAIPMWVIVTAALLLVACGLGIYYFGHLV